jgi:hypothetical protein
MNNKIEKRKKKRKKNMPFKIFNVADFDSSYVNLCRWAEIAGLIQADGGFSYLIVVDRKFRPRIRISQTMKRKAYIDNYIKPFFAKNNIPSPGESVARNALGETILLDLTNLHDCRIATHAFDLIEKITGRPLFFDDKLRDFLILKEGIRLHEENVAIRKPKSKEEQNKKDNIKKIIVDLKMIHLDCRDLSSDVVFIDRAEAERRMGLIPKDEPNANTVSDGAAKSTFDLIEQQVEQSQNEFLNKLKNNQINLKMPLNGYFISGCFTGDGATFIDTKTHDQKRNPEKKPFEFACHISYTEKSTRTHYLFELFAGYFEYDLKVRQSSKSAGVKANVYFIQNPTILGSSFKEFSQKFPSSIPRLKKRADLMQEALFLIPYQYIDVEIARKLVSLVWDNPEVYDPELRNLSRTQYEKIINNYFEKQKPPLLG